MRALGGTRVGSEAGPSLRVVPTMPSFDCRAFAPVRYFAHPSSRVRPFHTNPRQYMSTHIRAGNTEASARTERFKETLTLCLSAILVTASVLTVAVDAVNGSTGDAALASEPILKDTLTASKAPKAMIAPNALNVSFVKASADDARLPSTSAPAVAKDKAPVTPVAKLPVTSAAKATATPVAKAPVAPAVKASPMPVAESPATPAAAAVSTPTTKSKSAAAVETNPAENLPARAAQVPQPDSLAGRIKWLNEVTTSITDELDMIHPPPLKNLVAQATSSDMAHELEGVGKVFGTVANDLKEGFVGLEGTIESLSRGEAAGIHLPERLESSKDSAVGVVDQKPGTADNLPAKDGNF